MLHRGDCLDVLKTLPDNSVDSLVTDPPAGISFMGKAWDHDKGGRKQWIAWMTEVMTECMRVMKPGAHGLVWAIPRTSHWTGAALEDAGFEVRDVVTHLFGSGFPKSLDISKAIDKAAGVERERVKGSMGSNATESRGKYALGEAISGEAISVEAKQWQGYGTALKPAAEFWFLIRKPCSEKTVAANVLKWGCGALNIDGCRVEPSKDYGRSAANSKGTINSHNGFEGKSFKIAERNAETMLARMGRLPKYASTLGRFPANLILSHNPDCEEDQCSLGCAAAMLDAQSGTLKSGAIKKDQYKDGLKNDVYGKFAGFELAADLPAGSGGASRFFYCAKTSTSERNAGLGDMKNTHATVKSQKLMRYLCRLITPPNGVVLDPFMGSGSTGLAAISEGFRFMGIEKEKEYFDISQKRIDHALASLF